MRPGVVGLGIWCVDTTYKIDYLPERGKLESIKNQYQCVGGGPNNVLTNLSSLGFKYNLIAIGSIGNDDNSKLIKNHCRSNGIISKYLSVSSNISTSYSLCMSEKQNERTFLYYSGANDLLDINHFRLSKLSNYPKILYVGYLSLLGRLDKFNGKETRLCKVLKESRKKNIINIIEPQLLFKKQIIKSKNRLDKKLIINLSRKIFQKGLHRALIIHSPYESLYISKKDIYHSEPPKIQKKNIKNAVGAGDAFCAGFIFGVHEDWDIEVTLRKSHAAGSAMMKIDSSSGNLPNIKKL